MGMASLMSKANILAQSTPAQEERQGDAELRDLMRRYQDGCIDSFDSLYRHLAPQILGYLRWKAYDRNAADDLLQEVFLQVHRSRKTYHPRRPVKPWVFAIARYVWLMSYRKASRKSECPLDEIGEQLDLPVPAEAERIADRSLVGSALGKLTPEKRECFLLHHLWGFSFAEVGQILGVSAGTAKVRSHRARRELRLLIDHLSTGQK